MRGRVALAAAISAGCVAGCHRSEPAPVADLSPLCAAPATLSALKAELLPRGAGRRYMARLKTADVAFSDVQSTAADAEVARCSAHARLISPAVGSAPQAGGDISYGVRPHAGDAPELSGLQFADGGPVTRFAELLRHPRPADPAPVQPAAEVPDAAPADDAAPRSPPPALSDETQSLVDQAGDTRSSPRQDVSPPADAALNNIAGTY